MSSLKYESTAETTWAERAAFYLGCFAIIFTTVAYGAVHQPIIAVFYMIVAAMLILWAINGYSAGKLEIELTWFQVPLLAAIVWGLIQIIPFGSSSGAMLPANIPWTISRDPFATQLNVVHALWLLIFFSVTLMALKSATRIRHVVWLVVVFGFIYAFFSILQAVLSPTKIYGIYAVNFALPFGSFVNRHNFAAYMEMTMSLPLGLLFSGSIKHDKRLLVITAVVLMGIALLLSGSRGGFVALIAEIILLVLLTRKKRGTKELVLRAVLAAVLFAAVVVGAFFVGGESSLSRFMDGAPSSEVATNRQHIWSVTLKVIQDSFPLGSGLGAFGSAYPKFDTKSGMERVEQAHNDYLQVIADLGIVGIGVLALLIWQFFRQGTLSVKLGNRFRRGVAIGALAGCFAVMVHSIFDFVLHTTAITVLFATLVALLVASGREYPDDFRDENGHPGQRKRSRNIARITSNR